MWNIFSFSGSGNLPRGLPRRSGPRGKGRFGGEAEADRSRVGGRCLGGPGGWVDACASFLKYGIWYEYDKRYIEIEMVFFFSWFQKKDVAVGILDIYSKAL